MRQALSFIPTVFKLRIALLIFMFAYVILSFCPQMAIFSPTVLSKFYPYSHYLKFRDLYSSLTTNDEQH